MQTSVNNLVSNPLTLFFTCSGGVMIYIDRIEVVNKLAPYAGIFLSCFNKQHCDCFHSSSSSSVLVCNTASFFSVLVPLWFPPLSFMFVSASFSKSHRFAEVTVNSRTASPLKDFIPVRVRLLVASARAILFLGAEEKGDLWNSAYTAELPAACQLNYWDHYKGKSHVGAS